MHSGDTPEDVELVASRSPKGSAIDDLDQREINRFLEWLENVYYRVMPAKARFSEASGAMVGARLASPSEELSTDIHMTSSPINRLGERKSCSGAVRYFQDGEDVNEPKAWGKEPHLI
jgi:hypothetical protein